MPKYDPHGLFSKDEDKGKGYDPHGLFSDEPTPKKKKKKRKKPDASYKLPGVAPFAGETRLVPSLKAAAKRTGRDFRGSLEMAKEALYKDEQRKLQAGEIKSRAMDPGFDPLGGDERSAKLLLGALGAAWSPISGLAHGFIGEPIRESAKGLGASEKASKIAGEVASFAGEMVVPASAAAKLRKMSPAAKAKFNAILRSKAGEAADVARLKEAARISTVKPTAPTTPLKKKAPIKPVAKEHYARKQSIQELKAELDRAAGKRVPTKKVPVEELMPTAPKGAIKKQIPEKPPTIKVSGEVEKAVKSLEKGRRKDPFLRKQIEEATETPKAVNGQYAQDIIANEHYYKAALKAKAVEATSRPRARTAFKDEAEAALERLTERQKKPEKINFDDPRLREDVVKTVPDNLTGWGNRAIREPTVQRAITHTKKTKEPANYTAIDITNLSGMNKVFGERAADPIVRRITDTITDELRAAGIKSTRVRHGGDELSLITVGSDQAKINSALDIAGSKIKKWSEAVISPGDAPKPGMRLSEIQHPKKLDKPWARGTGIYHHTEMIKPSSAVDDVIEVAGKRLETIKETPPGAFKAAPVSGRPMVGGARQPVIKPTAAATKQGITAEEAITRGSNLEDSRNLIQGMEITTPMRPMGTRAKLAKLKREASETINSPEVVYSRHPVGKKIWKDSRQTEQAKNKFMFEHMTGFAKATKGIKGGSIEKIGQVLDGKLDKVVLNPKELRAHNYLKKDFDYLINKYARTVAGSDETYQKMLRAATRKYKPQSKIVDLEAPAAARYARLKTQLSQLRIGSKAYEAVRRQQRAILHSDWVGKLEPGAAKAYDALSRRVSDYLPHMFDKDQLLLEFKSEAARIQAKLKTATHPAAVTTYKNKLKQLEDSIIKMQQGYMVTYKGLPQNVAFKYLNRRTGKQGYSFDAFKAYESYLHGMAKKIYDEPMLKRAFENHKNLPPELKKYNVDYMRSFMGYDKYRFEDLANAVASTQYLLKLGFNARSAVGNLTQRINTVAKIGPLHSAKGQARAFMPKYKKMFDETGISREIPQVLFEGKMSQGFKAITDIAGFLFRRAELGNRRHAFLSALSKAEAKGLSPKKAYQYALDAADDTQFVYGKTGMPLGLRTPVGRTAGQFTSFSIKQMEFLHKLWKKDPKRFMAWMALSEGSIYTAREFLNADISNYLGVGATWGKVLDTFGSISEGDFRKAITNARLVFSGGGGILPSGPGPSVRAAIDLGSAIKKGKGLERLKRELTPIQFRRIAQSYDALMKKRDDPLGLFGGKVYPVADSRGNLIYYATSRELLQRTAGPAVARESQNWIESEEDYIYDQTLKDINNEIIDLMLDGKAEEAKRLSNKYGVIPSPRSIENARYRRKVDGITRGQQRETDRQRMFKIKMEE
jgi:diguanylate cyclase (GGDEF)-like protein